MADSAIEVVRKAAERLSKGRNGDVFAPSGADLDTVPALARLVLALARTPDRLPRAARAYDAKALELFGEYARLNFPQEVGV